jgi:ABC-type cobalamin/Fe3+-siderophores transport system ATPase subunit
VSPIDASGVGAVDIAAFALRIALWSLESEQKRNLFLLDEPFKHLRGLDNQKRTSTMVKTLSKKLSFQIIMVADVNFIIEADKIFNFVLNGTTSTLTDDNE